MRMDAIGFNVDTSTVTNRVKVDVDKIRKRAIATLKRRIRVQARRDIQTEYKIKAAAVKERLHVSSKFYDVRLVAKASGVGLIDFAARQTRSGVSYSIKRNEGRKTIAHAFIRKTRSGEGPYVWIRGEAAGRRYSKGYSGKFGPHLVRSGALHPGYEKHGYPIFPQFGPSVAQMLKHGKRPQRLADFAAQVVAKEITRLTR